MIHLCLLLTSATAALPVYFEPNRGQVKGATDWIAKTGRATLYLAGSRAAISVGEPGAKPRVMEFVGARQVRGVGESPTGGSSRFISSAAKAPELAHFAKVRYRGIYPGIDLVYYSTPDREIEYDLEIAPGADTRRLDLRFSGFANVRLDPDGALSLDLGGRNKLVHRRPKAFQNGREVQTSYRRIGAETVRLVIGDHDPGQGLTVDPVLDFSTYLGGPEADVINHVALDSGGFVYVAGSTQSPGGADFDPFQQASSAFPVAFLAKLTPDADRIIFLTTFAASDESAFRKIHIDANGDLLILGETRAKDFPMVNAFQSEFKAPNVSILALKLSGDGQTILWSTYFGGTGLDVGWASAIDGEGSLILAGFTGSRDFPTLDAIQAKFAGGGTDCFLSKLDSAGALRFSTYFGGSAPDTCSDAVGVDREGTIWLAGSTASSNFPLKDPLPSPPPSSPVFFAGFLANYSGDGKELRYSTLLPPDGVPSGLAFNTDGEIYLATSAAFNFNTVNPLQARCTAGRCAVLFKFDATGRTVLASTFLGGSGSSSPSSIASGADGSLFVTGATTSADFPIKDPLPEDQSLPAGKFLARLSPDLQSLLSSTFFGKGGDATCCGIAIDNQNRVYLTGGTPSSASSPTSNALQPNYGGGKSDGFLLRISDFKPQ